VQTDLGMGVALGATKTIPCKSVRGLQPIIGNDVICVITAGTTPQI
jgi:hypothetical protein